MRPAEKEDWLRYFEWHMASARVPEVEWLPLFKENLDLHTKTMIQQATGVQLTSYEAMRDWLMLQTWTTDPEGPYHAELLRMGGMYGILIIIYIYTEYYMKTPSGSITEPIEALVRIRRLDLKIDRTRLRRNNPVGVSEEELRRYVRVTYQTRLQVDIRVCYFRYFKASLEPAIRSRISDISMVRPDVGLDLLAKWALEMWDTAEA